MHAYFCISLVKYTGVVSIGLFALLHENRLTLVRRERVLRIILENPRVNLQILAGGGDGPRPPSKSIRSRDRLPWIHPIDSSELLARLFIVMLQVSISRKRQFIDTYRVSD